MSYDKKKDYQEEKPYNKKGKNGKGNSRYSGKERSDKRTNTGYIPGNNGGDNDVSWYNHYPELMKNSATLHFSRPQGLSWSLDVPSGDPGTKMAFNDQVMPGIMNIPVIPTPGNSSNFTSALNSAALKIYSFVRHANAGHSNYDTADLMMYLQTVDSAYSFYAWMTRFYGLLRVYSTSNRYLPTGILAAMGLTQEQLQTFISCQADLRAYIDLYAIKLGSLAVPANIDYFKRHQFMFSNVYMDSPLPKAQLYMFNPACFYMFEEQSGGPGFLRAVKFKVASYMTLGALATYGDSLLSHAIGSEDIGIMSGDIKKAFGDKLYSLSALDANYTCVPVYSPEVLSQIQNATLYPISVDATVDGHTADITQTATVGGHIVYDPYFEIGSTADTNALEVLLALMGNRLLSIDNIDPSPEHVMVATRLTSVPDGGPSADGKKYYINFDNLHKIGTEIACAASITCMVPGTDGSLVNSYSTISNIHYIRYCSSDLALGKSVNIVHLLENFSMHPMMTVVVALPDTVPSAMRLFEPDNYTVVNADDLGDMHECACMSMYYVPGMGD